MTKAQPVPHARKGAQSGCYYLVLYVRGGMSTVAGYYPTFRSSERLENLISMMISRSEGVGAEWFTEFSGNITYPGISIEEYLNKVRVLHHSMRATKLRCQSNHDEVV